VVSDATQAGGKGCRCAILDALAGRRPPRPQHRGQQRTPLGDSCSPCDPDSGAGSYMSRDDGQGHTFFAPAAAPELARPRLAFQRASDSSSWSSAASSASVFSWPGL
jgi:hypothetical protein